MKAKYIILLEDDYGIRHAAVPVYFDTFGAARGALLEELARDPAPQTVEQEGERRWKVVETETMALDWEEEPLSIETVSFYTIEEVKPSESFTEGGILYTVVGRENDCPVVSGGFPTKREALEALKRHCPGAREALCAWVDTDPETETARAYSVTVFKHAPKELL